MRAAYYEKNGAPRDVLQIGEVDTPHLAGARLRRIDLADMQHVG